MTERSANTLDLASRLADALAIALADGSWGVGQREICENVLRDWHEHVGHEPKDSHDPNGEAIKAWERLRTRVEAPKS